MSNFQILPRDGSVTGGGNHVQNSLFRFKSETKLETGRLNSAMSGQATPFQGLQQEEVLNINILYLETLHALLNQYIIACFRGEMEQSLNVLQLLAVTMSPKIDTEKEERQIDFIESHMGQAIMRDQDGQIIRYSPDMLNRIRRATRIVYKSLLTKLNVSGMLTFTPKDYKAVLGDFSKA
jgi:hypothetical protein